MNLDIVNNFNNVLIFLQNTMGQLKDYNTISVNDLKMLCYIVYKQNTIENYQEISPVLLTALSFINEKTKVYFNTPRELTEVDEIYEGYINNNLKDIFKE